MLIISKAPPKIVLYIILMSFVLIGLALVFSEIAFYIQFKSFYYSRLSSTLEEGSEFARYRKPFTIKKDHRFRILTIGGSTTYGHGLPEQASWPSVLQERLEKEYPDQFEVINLGRVGGHLEEFILNHQNSSKVFIPREKWIKSPLNRPGKNQVASWGWKDLDPDLILLAPVINDLGPDYMVASQTSNLSQGNEAHLKIPGQNLFDKKFALSYYLRRLLLTTMALSPDSAEVEKEKLSTIRKSYQNNLEKYLDLWQEKKVILLGLPLLFKAKDGAKEVKKAGLFWNLANVTSLEREVEYLPKLEALGKEVRAKIKSKKGMVVHEIGLAVKEKPFNERLRLYLDSIHTNIEGAALVADEIFDHILIHLSFKPLREEQFQNRKMESVLLHLDNANFEIHTSKKGQLHFPNWTIWNQKSNQIKVSAGYHSISALELTSNVRNEEDEGYEDLFRVSATTLVPEAYRTDDSFFSVSAWIWSDKPLCASLGVNSENGKKASSFPHSGNSSWEYLTVAYPFLETNKSYDISFVNRGCKAKVDQIQPVLIRDNRFRGLHGGGYKRFRERITYKKDHRIRIIIVGGSTIWGAGAERNSTISYLLQSKLESLYPNTFEVINYGVSGWTLAGQIVSVNGNFYFDRFVLTMKDSDNVFLPNIPRVPDESPYKYSQAILNAIGIKALNPDVVILGSLWNDVGAAVADSRGFYRIRLPDNELLHVKFYRQMFQYAEQPNQGNKKRLITVVEQIRSMKATTYLKEHTFPVPETIEDVDNPVNQQRGIDSYYFYITEFINRASRLSDVWLLNLPNKGGPNVLTHLEKVPLYFEIKNRKSIKNEHRYWWYWIFMQGKIQKEVMQKISEERNIPFIDTGAAFDNQFSDLNSVKYANLDVFTDSVHFTNLGNAFIADRIFKERKDTFAKMVLEKASQRMSTTN